MKLLLLPLIFFCITANAKVWFEPSLNLWLGNICQTSIGWQYVNPQPVGSLCHAPSLNSMGFIANR